MDCGTTGEIDVEPEEHYDVVNHVTWLRCPACGESLDPETLEPVSSGS